MKDQLKNIASICAQEWESQLKNEPHILPLFATSSFTFDNIEDSIDVFQQKKEGHVYSRYGNPTVDTVEQKLAGLESFGLDKQVYCRLTNSGLSAISTLLFSVLKPGDTLLTSVSIYGGTLDFMRAKLSQFGIQICYVDFSIPKDIQSAIEEHKKIKLIYCESPSNPTLSCTDLEYVQSLAQSLGALTVIDNTFCTPYLQKPLNYGFDFVIYSTTKYLNGHGNAISGAIISTDEKWDKEIWSTIKLHGSNPSPFDVWLLYNGMKTLHIRMDRHCQNAIGLAKALEDHPKVDFVNYPGLKSSPSHAIATKQMSQYGGMLSFSVKGGLAAGIKLLNNLKLATITATLGNVDTIVLHPATSSHLNVPKEQREKSGITDGLIRVSIGIEDVDDIKHDFFQALDKV